MHGSGYLEGMDTLGTYLKKARDEQHLSLTDISAQTNISIQYLEAIERDDFAALPATYMRAFVREYSLLVGLDPKDTLARYPEAGGTRHHGKPIAHAAERTMEDLSDHEKVGARGWVSDNPWFARGTLMIVLIGTLAFALWYAVKNDSPSPPSEIPFQSVVKENEARIAPLLEAAKAKQDTAAHDTLHLSAVTLDTVWMQIVIDNGEPQEYIFYPNRTSRWTALNRFVLTLGNAGGISFSLNGTNLGTLGKRGIVIRNRELTRSALAARTSN